MVREVEVRTVGGKGRIMNDRPLRPVAAALDLLIALEAPQRADARAVRSDFLSVPLLESSRARLVVRRLAERRNAKKADDDAGGEGAPAPERGCIFQLRAQIGVLLAFARPSALNSSVGVGVTLAVE